MHFKLHVPIVALKNWACVVWYDGLFVVRWIFHRIVQFCSLLNIANKLLLTSTNTLNNGTNFEKNIPVQVKIGR